MLTNIGTLRPRNFISACYHNGEHLQNNGDSNGEQESFAVSRWRAEVSSTNNPKLKSCREWIANCCYGSPTLCCSSMPRYGLPLLPQAHLPAALVCWKYSSFSLPNKECGSIIKTLHSGAHFCIVFIWVHWMNGQPNRAKVSHFHLTLNLTSYNGNHWITIDPPLSHM